MTPVESPLARRDGDIRAVKLVDLSKICYIQDGGEMLDMSQRSVHFPSLDLNRSFHLRDSDHCLDWNSDGDALSTSSFAIRTAVWGSPTTQTWRCDRVSQRRAKEKRRTLGGCATARSSLTRADSVRQAPQGYLFHVSQPGFHHEIARWAEIFWPGSWVVDVVRSEPPNGPLGRRERSPGLDQRTLLGLPCGIAAPVPRRNRGEDWLVEQGI
ncbi:hypothetical protein DOTSEDRAFT_74280 [Dothistroma septosporum NZE10]|uniref:Uncharacterized protein n=1 Tax=Dothistroma septosporum (strain NZE10 / CBS 128990) TaxID=675120 RepID=N1PGL8_DOTSN|nr:hypothetical protein DOTSEDRAFT_74280 [Dothistroma septosporum NZE10]